LGGVCGEGEVTIKMRSTAGGDEIQHPSTPTTTGVLQVDSSEGNDTGSINDVTFVIGGATKLAFTTQPSFFATTNINLDTQPVVEVQDAAGNKVSSSVAITLSAVLATDTNTAGSGTLNATTNPLSATDGVASFAGVNYTADEDIKIKATAGGLTTAFSDAVLVSVPDSTPPEILSEASTESETSATIAWETDEEASSQIEYGLTDSYGNETEEENTVPRVKNHSVNIPSLAACTKYNYRAKSKDRANNGKNGEKKTFTTKGCPGDASVLSQTDSNIDPGSGGTIDLLDNGKGITVNTPAGYSVSTANFQIKKLEKEPIINSLSSPSSYSLAGDYIYSLDALTGVSTKLSSFNQPVSVTISYDDADISSFEDELGLRIFHHDGSSWSELSNCTVNTVTNKVTCTTTSFSVFGLFGEVLADIGSATGLTQANAPVCSDASPGSKAPWLYAATPESSTSIRLRFSSGDKPFDRYALEYGTSPDNYIFAADNIGGKDINTYLVNSLAPHTIYYFRIRAGNGCATGPWSNEIFATTLSSVKEKIDFPSLEISTKKGNTETDKYKLIVKIVDPNDKPIAGVKVVLFSTAQEKITDKNGLVEFDNIDSGNHRLVINYQDQQNEHTINLSSDEKEVSITISLERKPSILKNIALMIAVLGIAGLAVYLIYKKATG
jgi:hypothetical protein